MLLHFHDGVSDFPRGAGPSDPGWYCYPDGVAPEPLGPFVSESQARSAGFHFSELRRAASS
jgi:hypothetical protein